MCPVILTIVVEVVTCVLLLLTVDGGKLEVWDTAAEASSPLCSVSADDAAIVQIVVRVGRSMTVQIVMCVGRDVTVQIVVCVGRSMTVRIVVRVGRVTGQLADCQLADWTTRGLGISQTGQLADWTTRVLDKSRTGQLADATVDFACLVFVLLAHLRDRELSSPRLVQSVS